MDIRKKKLVFFLREIRRVIVTLFSGITSIGILTKKKKKFPRLDADDYDAPDPKFRFPDGERLFFFFLKHPSVDGRCVGGTGQRR